MLFACFAKMTGATCPAWCWLRARVSTVQSAVAAARAAPATVLLRENRHIIHNGCNTGGVVSFPPLCIQQAITKPCLLTPAFVTSVLQICKEGEGQSGVQAVNLPDADFPTLPTASTPPAGDAEAPKWPLQKVRQTKTQGAASGWDAAPATPYIPAHHRNDNPGGNYSTYQGGPGRGDEGWVASGGDDGCGGADAGVQKCFDARV